jgi:anthranilate 1,2-dioxygenase ferredoxin reductase subunit
MICIVGAGLAGDTAAATLRAEGYAGRIVLISDEPVPPYDRPPLSKEALAEDVREDRIFLRAESWYEEQDIELLLGKTVTAIDRTAKALTFSDDTTLPYEKLILATGARARGLPGMEATGVPTFVVRTIEDARGLKATLTPGARVAVIGAGVIGLEVAASAIKRGCRVDVIDIADRVLSRVAPPAFSQFMADLHTTNGVKLHLAAGSAALVPGGVDTGAHGHIAADAIVIGIGVLPNIELAETAGLATRDGILVDGHARTSDPDIYAIGDVTRYPDPFAEGRDRRCENWKHAQAHAIVAARSILGTPDEYGTASSMWSDQFDVKLQTVGRLEGEEVARGAFGSAKFMTLYRDARGVVVGAIGVNSAKDMRFAQALIEKKLVIEPALLADPKQDLRKLAA